MNNFNQVTQEGSSILGKKISNERHKLVRLLNAIKETVQTKDTELQEFLSDPCNARDYKPTENFFRDEVESGIEKLQQTFRLYEEVRVK